MRGDRLDYLDAVRAYALILGIVFHASLSFVPVFIGWAVMDVSTSDGVVAFTLISHSFRMPLFFLIAGFFGHMTYHSKGTGAFLRSRFVRIVIPFAAGWFLLRPLLVSGWIMGADSLRGDVDVLSGLIAGFASLGELPNSLFVGTHLWFLYYLTLATGIALILRAAPGLLPSQQSALTGAADRVMTWLANSRAAMPILAVPTAGCLWFMRHWGLDTPDQSLVPHAPVLCLNAGFFLFGWLLHRQPEQIEAFSRLTASRIVLCILALVMVLGLADFEQQPEHPDSQMFKAGFSFAYAALMWTLVSISIGVFKRLFDRPSAAVRYVADASYWLYLVHLPLVVWLQVAVAEWPVHWSLKLGLVSMATILGSLVIYDLFVRSTFIGATLNGRRKPRLMTRASALSRPRRAPAARGE